MSLICSRVSELAKKLFFRSTSMKNETEIEILNRELSNPAIPFSIPKLRLIINETKETDMYILKK